MADFTAVWGNFTSWIVDQGYVAAQQAFNC